MWINNNRNNNYDDYLWKTSERLREKKTKLNATNKNNNIERFKREKKKTPENIIIKYVYEFVRMCVCVCINAHK